MKKSLISLVVVVILITQSFVQLHAQETERPNHYTQVIVYFAMESLTEEYDVTRYMQRYLESMGWIKVIMERTDTTMQLHQYAFGPFPLSDDPARDSILDAEGYTGKRTLAYRAWYGMNQSLKDSQNPVAQKLQNIKNQTGADVVTVIILVNSQYYGTYCDFDHNDFQTPIMVVTNSSSKNTHFPFHNQIIFDETSTKAKAYIGEYSHNHPVYPTYTNYSTLLNNFGYVLLIYPRKGLYQDKYGFWLQVGDDDHNVLDPDHGWKLDYLYNKGDLGTDLGFRTIFDTLTIKANEVRLYDLYPGWNDYGTDTILYTSGDSFGKYEDHREAQYLCAFQAKREDVGETEIEAYAPKITGIPDAFAMDYILVQFVEEIEYPTLQPIENIKVNEEFTISLAGNPELMTSWIPEITISGIEYEFIKSNNYTYTYKALSSGTATINMLHNSLLVLEDEYISFQVLPDKTPDAPKNLTGIIKNDDIELNWDNMTEVSFTVYRNANKIVENRYFSDYTDTSVPGNGNYTYYVTASNNIGESEKSNEVSFSLTSVTETNDNYIQITPNPAGDYIYISINPTVNRRVDEGSSEEIAIYNVLGEKVLTANILENKSINISLLTSGVYILHIGEFSTKFVKE